MGDLATNALSEAHMARCRVVVAIMRLRGLLYNDKTRLSDILTREIRNSPKYQDIRIPRDLLGLVTLFRTSSATDPRDSIYGLLGLTSLLDEDTDKEAGRINVDYTKSMEEVFIDFARATLNWSNPARLLRHVKWPRSDSGTLPSWVPDWCEVSAPRSLVDLYKPVRPLADVNDTSVILASDWAYEWFLGSTDHRVLPWEGKCFGTIRSIGEVLNNTSHEEDMQVWRSWDLLAFAHGGTPPRSFRWSRFGKNIASTESRALCAGRRFLLRVIDIPAL
ncbi:hypothetical protein M011DRAFT_293660 [Sporormia fimetaria CBS 119925]|uniref:Uncharacterized protein n=1 Tax=Sporormia fimetaria CBS 119925 TaxID=1340428 RepID=A0A6A6UV37_9PLEO|nr:hypothetical protein M011DRAFT_293660 [Sporormia fimetaria CBS 119925]